jgi:hypothetical protein
MADNAAMNRLIASRASRAHGVVGRLGDIDTRERRAALNAAMAEAEHAIKVGDPVARELAEERIDTILAEARAARQPRGEEFDRQR